MNSITQKEIDELKKVHGTIYSLTCEDGRMLIIVDPLANFSKAKLILQSLGTSTQEFAEVVIKNCAVAGDMELVEDEAFATGVADELKDLIDMPQAKIHDQGEYVTLECEGADVVCRRPTRNDLVMAAKKDRLKEPFGEAMQLLGLIAHNDEWKQLEATNSRALIGILAGTEELKNKKAATVKKL